MEFDEDSVQYKNQFKPVDDYLFGQAIHIYGDDLFATEYNSNGSFYHYQNDGINWNFVTSYMAPANTYLGRDIIFDGQQLLVSTNNSIQIFGVKSPTITSISQGDSKSRSKISWENNSELMTYVLKFFVMMKKLLQLQGQPAHILIMKVSRGKCIPIKFLLLIL